MDRKGRLWTAEEEDFVAENWGKYTKKYIADKLKRTVCAVEFRAWALGLGAQKDAQGLYNTRMLAAACGVDCMTVQGWITKGLKTKKTVISCGKYKIRAIEINDFWKFAEKNKDKINFGKIKRGELFPEPEWFKDLRLEIDIARERKRDTRWTQEEDGILLSYIKLNRSRQEIANRLNRSKKAVEHRVERLRKAGTIPPATKKFWTEKENKLFLDLEKEGLTDAEIAKMLDRKREHIVDHRRLLRKKGEYKGMKGARNGN